MAKLLVTLLGLALILFVNIYFFGRKGGRQASGTRERSGGSGKISI